MATKTLAKKSSHKNSPSQKTEEQIESLVDMIVKQTTGKTAEKKTLRQGNSYPKIAA